MVNNSECYPIVQLELEALRPYDNNAKMHPENQITLLADQILRFGWDQPIVVDGDHLIIKGHGRYLAAKKLGLSMVPCIVRNDLTDEEVFVSRIADNKIAESPWDFNLLNSEFLGLKKEFGYTTQDLVELGFSVSEVNFIQADWVPGVSLDETEADANPAIPAEVRKKVCCPNCQHLFYV